MYNLATHETFSWWERKVWKYSIFDALGEEYFCHEKILVTEVLETILFSFHIKQAWEKCWKDFYELAIFFKKCQNKPGHGTSESIREILYRDPLIFLLNN